MSAGPLPQQAAERIRDSLGQARLARSDAEDVARELEAHFQDGLARGQRIESLLQDFGDPALAGTLIGRGIRRRRRHANPAAFALRIFSLAAAGAYLASFARLHVAGPETPAVRTPERRSEALAAWSMAAPGIAESAARARGLIAEARDAARRGEEELSRRRRAEALDAALEISRGPSPAHDLAALRLAAETGLPAPDLAWRPEKVRGAFGDLLARFYTAGDRGRLTAAGLRLFQAWKGKTDPGLAAILLEPAYFPHAAGRAEAVREFERFLALAEEPGPAFERERASLQASAWQSLRFVALAVPLEHLAAVRAAGRRCAGDRRS
jgi:hypothetical protein